MRGQANRYLQSASGRDVSGRGLPAILSFASLPLALALSVLGALVGGGLAVACFALGLVLFIAWPIALILVLVNGSRALEAGTLAWFAGNDEPAIAAAHRVLRRVFRSDLRTRAFHLLALCAERRCDFAESVDLLERAEQALPLMAAPNRKRYARLLMGGHRALGLLALGRIPEAHSLLVTRSAEHARVGETTTLDILTDDGSWGLGSISMNETLMKLERGRDPRAVISLAWAVLHAKSGNLAESGRLLAMERPVLDHWLLPYELDLAQLLYRRSQGQDVAAEGVWASRLLGEG